MELFIKTQADIIFTARKRSLRRLCFYPCLSAILFTGGVPGQVHPPGQVPHILQAGTPPGTPPRYTPRQVHPLAGIPPGRHTQPGRYTPPTRYSPYHSACWDTVNKRAVRIPLECILVLFMLFIKNNNGR